MAQRQWPVPKIASIIARLGLRSVRPRLEIASGRRPIQSHRLPPRFALFRKRASMR